MSKLALYLFLCHYSVAAVMAHESEAQSRPMTEIAIELGQKSLSLKELFTQIESSSEFVFAYRNKDVSGKQVVLSGRSKTLDSVLKEVADQTGYGFRRVNGTITVQEVRKGEPLVDIVDAKETITGTVIDAETGEPLIGATVLVKSTAVGTVTDINGTFTIEAAVDAVLSISFIGYKMQEVAINGRSQIDVSLEFDAEALDEVVVVGYGEKKKTAITGAISAIEGKEIANNPVPNLENSLAGKVSGVYATSNSGQPGAEDVNLVIRGIGTLGNNAPTIVIDGVANRGSISRLDPNDIESVTVLKDASAAIYGSQSANGVILVTTKRGSKGKAPELTYSFNQGFSNPTVKPELANAYDYASYRNDYFTDTGGVPEFSDDDLEAMKTGSDPDNGRANTDWWDEVVQKNASIQRHALSLSGGSGRVSYFVSGGYLKQDGIFRNGAYDFEQYNYRSNLDIQVNDVLKLGVDLAGRVQERDEPSAASNSEIWWSVTRTYPYYPAYYSNGLPWTGLEDGWNPVIMGTDQGGVDSRKSSVFNNRIMAELKLPFVEGLSVDGWLAFDMTTGPRKRITKNWEVYSKVGDDYIPMKGGRTDGTTLYEERGNSTMTTAHGKIKYDRYFDKHRVSAFVAYEQSLFAADTVSAFRRGFITGGDNLQLFAGAAEGATNSGWAYEYARRNYFGRFSYEYDDKYLLDATFRYDGSQNFPEDNRYGFFPGISVGYRISEEPFLQGAAFLDNLKVRGSWGKLGNDRVDEFQYLTTYNLQGNQYLFGADNLVRSYQEGVSPNPNITWEVARTTNVGIESSFYNRLIELEADLFVSNRSNILTPRNASVPTYSGLDLPDENIGEVESKGFELMLAHSNQINDFSYRIAGNYSYSKNEVVYMDEAPTDFEYQRKTGKPYGAELFYPTDGLLTQEDLDNGIAVFSDQARPGDIKFLDSNDDGVINGEDRIRMEKSTRLPNVMYGVTLNAEYKGFYAELFFQGAAQVYRYLNTDDAGIRGNFLSEFFTDRWTDTNTDASFPRVNFQNTSPHSGWQDQKADFFLQDASYFRLRSAQIGYNFKTEWISKLKMQSLRLYVGGSNLFFVFNKYKYGDPEQNVGEGRFAYYPQQKIVNAGLSVTF